MLCRFTGAVKRFYSVAEHSVRVAVEVGDEDGLRALLHDAAEAYLGDMAGPLKKQPEFASVYKEVEARVQAAILEAFGLEGEEPESVKLADRRLLLTESRDLLDTRSDEVKELWAPWQDGQAPLRNTIQPWSQPAANREFLADFKRLGGMILG